MKAEMEETNIIKANTDEKINAENNDGGSRTASKNLKVILIAKVAISLLVAILSFTCFSNIASSPKFHKDAIEMLDQKKITVMELSAGAALVANSASLVLGDRALPVANKLMDLTGYFLLILCAIILEKYLLTILGLVSFKILLPLASLLFLISVFIINKGIERISIKLAIFSLVIFMVIPASVGISHLIENTYSTNVQVLIESTKEMKQEADKIESENIDANRNIEENSKKELENIDTQDFGNDIFGNISNFFNTAKTEGSKIVSNTKENISNALGNISEKAKELFTKATKLLSNMIEVIAIMIVTTCIMPLLVLLFFIWIIKLFFGIEIKTDNIKLPKV